MGVEELGFKMNETKGWIQRMKTKKVPCTAQKVTPGTITLLTGILTGCVVVVHMGAVVRLSGHWERRSGQELLKPEALGLGLSPVSFPALPPLVANF